MPGSVLIVGDTNVDLIIRLPERAGGVSQPEPHMEGGGTAANTAVALARLGVPVSFAGAIGGDGYGRWIVEDFGREAVDTRGLIILEHFFTPIVFVIVSADGERYPIIWPTQGWAHTQLRPEDLDPALIGGARWLHTTGMCLRASPACEAVLHAMELARAAGITVSIDLNLRAELWGWPDEVRRTVERAIELADVVFGSAHEEIALVAGRDDVQEAARALCAGRRTIVARLGAQGTLAAAPAEEVHVPAFPTTLVNTVGAGDAFNGGFIAARLDGASVRDALRWGNAVAALKIRGDSARALPTRAAVKRVLGEQDEVAG